MGMPPHQNRPGEPVGGLRRHRLRQPAPATDPHGLGSRPRRAAPDAGATGSATTNARRSSSPRTVLPTAICRAPQVRSTTRSASSSSSRTCGPHWRPSARACRCAATSCGRCSTTSSGPGDIADGSVSFTSTSRPSSARPSPAPTAIARSSPPTDPDRPSSGGLRVEGGWRDRAWSRRRAMRRRATEPDETPGDSRAQHRRGVTVPARLLPGGVRPTWPARTSRRDAGLHRTRAQHARVGRRRLQPIRATLSTSVTGSPVRVRTSSSAQTTRPTLRSNNRVTSWPFPDCTSQRSSPTVLFSTVTLASESLARDI